MTDARQRTHTLRDGRTLGFAQYGNPSGAPVLYMHGTPGSRLELALPGVDDELAQRGLRAIAVDRPGIGLSTFRPGRAIADWPADVAELADALGLGRFAVLGVSGGAPYALACAHRLGARLTAAGVVAGVAPRGAPGWDAMPARNRRLFALARWCAPALRPVVRRIGGAIARDADGALERLFDRVAPVDAAALARGPARDALLASWAECLRQGPDGVWWDLVLEARAWGFPLAGVALPVLLWFGGADRTVPPAMGHHLARVLPQCEARHYPAEGHFTIVLNRRGEILDRLAAAVGARAGP